MRRPPPKQMRRSRQWKHGGNRRLLLRPRQDRGYALLQEREQKLPNSLSPRPGDQAREGNALVRVWLDRRLTFNTHIEKWSLKASKVVSQLRFVNNTIRGTSAAAARRAVYAVVLPTLLYGLDTWFPGFPSESTHKSARTITKTQTSKLQ